MFGLALDACRADPRVATRLGSPLSGYGVESSSRAARQRIRHKIEKDATGTEHILIQFQLRGPRGVATVFADGVRDGSAPGGYRMGFIRVTDPNGTLRPFAVETEASRQAAAEAFAAHALPPPLALAGDGMSGGASSGGGAARQGKSVWGTFTGR